MSSTTNVTVNTFPNIETDNMDNPIPKKKRVKVEYVVLVSGLDRTRYDSFVRLFCMQSMNLDFFFASDSQSIGRL